jgi:hypothetical protein
MTNEIQHWATRYWSEKLCMNVPEHDLEGRAADEPMIGFRDEEIASMLVYNPGVQELLKRLPNLFLAYTNVHAAVFDSVNTPGWVKVERVDMAPNVNCSYNEALGQLTRLGYRGQRLSTYILAHEMIADLRLGCMHGLDSHSQSVLIGSHEVINGETTAFSLAPYWATPGMRDELWWYNLDYRNPNWGVRCEKPVSLASRG